jgi:methylenetetrahydrofolate dehydrogenase (NADP+)/methenyltetrahydrofolate cyclohydrolase
MAQSLDMPGNPRKAALRSEMIARRDALPGAERERIAAAFLEMLLALPQYQAARSVLATASIGSEFGTGGFIDASVTAGKTIVLPRVTEPPRHLAIYAVPDVQRDLRPGVWQIPEPDPARCQEVAFADVDFALVPALAADRAGFRLGYGAGYFDGLLAGRGPRPFCVTALPAALHRGVAAQRPARHPRGPGDRRARRAAGSRGMSAKVIDGKAIAQAYRAELALRVERLREGGTAPGLAVVIVGDDPASKVYVRNKALASEGIGVRSQVHPLPADTSQATLIALVKGLNADPSVHGILVQLPLPRHIASRAVIEAISPDKDVDGFHYRNIGALLVGEPGYYPCTPWGIMKMLEHESIAIEGRHAVVVGRSTIVGKPMALMLLQAGATVTICHSKTPDLGAMTRQADILVAAVGRARLIAGDMVKPGSVVIDVGVNRLPDGSLAGDVDYEAAARVASHITPVPGGVGPMTIAMLLGNTVKSAERVSGLGAPMETRIA